MLLFCCKYHVTLPYGNSDLQAGELYNYFDGIRLIAASTEHINPNYLIIITEVTGITSEMK